MDRIRRYQCPEVNTDTLDGLCDIYGRSSKPNSRFDTLTESTHGRPPVETGSPFRHRVPDVVLTAARYDGEPRSFGAFRLQVTAIMMLPSCQRETSVSLVIYCIRKNHSTDARAGRQGLSFSHTFILLAHFPDQGSSFT
jgi:hypothetical protein